MHGNAPIHDSKIGFSLKIYDRAPPALSFHLRQFPQRKSSHLIYGILLLVTRSQTKALVKLYCTACTVQFRTNSDQTFLRPKDSFVYFGCVVGPHLGQRRVSTGRGFDQVFQLSKVAWRASRDSCKQMYSLVPLAILGCKHNFKIASHVSSPLSFLGNPKL